MPHPPTSSSSDRSDRILLASVLLLAGWIAVSGPLDGRRLALATGVAACTGIYLAARSLGSRRPTLIAVSVAVAPVVLTVITGAGPGAGGPLSYPNASAAVLFVGAGAALLLSFRARSRRVRGAWAVTFTVYAFLPWYMGSYAAAVLILALPVAAWLARGERARRRWLVSCVGCLVVAVGITVALGATYQPGDRDGSLERLVDATLSERRVQLWADALALITASPATGVGPGNFVETSPTAIANPDTAPAHSEFLQIGAETGVIGLVLGLLAAIAGIARWREPGTGGAVAATVVAGLALHSSMDYVLHFPVVPLIAVALVGAESAGVGSPALTIGPHDDHGPTSGPVRLVAAVTMGLVLIALLPWGPLNPPVYRSNGAEIHDDGVIGFAEPGLARTLQPPVDVYEEVTAANTFTLTMWVRSAERAQDGPARIVSSSDSTKRRNFTVAQDGDDLVVRLRTSVADENGTEHELRVPEALGDLRPHHVAVLVDTRIVTVHVDGRVRAWGAPDPLDLSSWDDSFPVVFGNELDQRRPWLGEVRDVDMSGVAVPLAEVPGLAERPTKGLDQPLVMPQVLSGAPGTLLETATDLSQHGQLLGWNGWRAAWAGQSTRVLRPLATLALFAAWAAATLGRRRGTNLPPVAVVTLVMVGGVGLAVGLEWGQFLQGRSASVIDAAVAVSGTALGAVHAALARGPERGRARLEASGNGQPGHVSLSPRGTVGQRGSRTRAERRS